MSTTITAKLNRPASIFQAGDSTGFGLRLGVQYYDRETKQKEWTNYEVAIFAKAPAQVDFYTQALIEGAVVEISAKSEKIKQFQGQNGLSLSIELIDASVGYIHTGQQPQQPQAQQSYQQQAPQNTNQGQYQQQQPAPQQGGYQQQPAPQINPQAPVVDFRDDIPF